MDRYPTGAADPLKSDRLRRLGTQVRGHIECRYGGHWHARGPWTREHVPAVRARLAAR